MKTFPDLITAFTSRYFPSSFTAIIFNIFSFSVIATNGKYLSLFLGITILIGKRLSLTIVFIFKTLLGLSED